MHVRVKLKGQEGHLCSLCLRDDDEQVTSALVEVLVVDDDAVADRGEAQTVSEGVRMRFGVHLHGLSSSSLDTAGTAPS